MSYSKTDLLRRLQSANKFYAKASSTPPQGASRSEKEIILDSMEYTFKCLRDYSIDPSFGVLYVLYGDEFLKYEFGKTMEDFINAE